MFKTCSRLTGLLLIPLLKKLYIYKYIYIYANIYKKFVQISQESSALRVVSADLTGKIKERQDVLELILKRLAWALRGLCVSFPPFNIYMCSMFMLLHKGPFVSTLSLLQFRFRHG